MTAPIDDSRFTLVPSGRFRERAGPHPQDAGYSNKKLCLVATDATILVELLYGLSLRPDCFYVKYGTVARDGMYLGRCMLATDEAVSELCQELKGHPHLMVSLQDDSWFNAFREPPVANGACGVWDDWAEHEADVATVVSSAFGREHEANLVVAVRAAGAATISLVAGIPPEPRTGDWPIVGYVLLSPVSIDGCVGARGLGLAPLAVLPSQQRKGFGASLVRAALRRARLLGYDFVVVLGDPRYYARFGFVPGSSLGLSYPEPLPQPNFQALELVPGSLAQASGVVRYHSAIAL